VYHRVFIRSTAQLGSVTTFDGSTERVFVADIEWCDWSKRKYSGQCDALVEDHTMSQKRRMLRSDIKKISKDTKQTILTAGNRYF
jgi:hypothetical protein